MFCFPFFSNSQYSCLSFITFNRDPRATDTFQGFYRIAPVQIRSRNVPASPALATSPSWLLFPGRHKTASDATNFECISLVTLGAQPLTAQFQN